MARHLSALFAHFCARSSNGNAAPPYPTGASGPSHEATARTHHTADRCVNSRKKTHSAQAQGLRNDDDGNADTTTMTMTTTDDDDSIDETDDDDNERATRFSAGGTREKIRRKEKSRPKSLHVLSTF